jgi:hypothetical protein
MTYLSEKGYQPVNAYWAEEDLILTDEFRDGNVPAGMDLLSVLKAAISVLPSTVRLVRVRSDSAAYVHELPTVLVACSPQSLEISSSHHCRQSH